MTELRALTGLRGVAAWWVVLYHLRLSVADVPGPIMTVLSKGYLAVDFFFLLSGFVIQLSWSGHFAERGTAAALPFLVKRIARVWPLHALILGCFVALAALLHATGRPSPDYPWAELPSHLVLIHNWGWTWRLTWNDPSWSISVEFAAYLLFVPATLLLIRRTASTAVLIAAAVAPLLALHVAMRDQPSLGADIVRLGLTRCLAEFACGAALAALWRRTRGDRRALPVACALTSVAASAYALGAPESLAVPAGCAGLLLAASLTAGRPGNPLESRAIHYLGEISYATYLSHILLWTLFKLALPSLPIGWGTLALFALLLVAVSAMLYAAVERPAQAWLQALLLPAAERLVSRSRPVPR